MDFKGPFGHSEKDWLEGESRTRLLQLSIPRVTLQAGTWRREGKGRN